MPVMSCQSDGKPGFKFGDSGHCYTFDPKNPASKERARQEAIRQGAAEHAHGKAPKVIHEGHKPNTGD